MRFLTTVLMLPLVTAAGCSAKDPTPPSFPDAISISDAERLAAFDHVKQALAQEAHDARLIKTVGITVDDTTLASVITDIVPPKGLDDSRGATPESLQGVFWMRGNPLPDYLLSFANFHWTSVEDTSFGFLSTFAPGSFAWKNKMVAQGAPDGDEKYVPEICRVPKTDPVLGKIARLQATYNPDRFRHPVAEDMAEIGTAAAGEVTDDAAATFIAGVWESGQLPLDGAESVQALDAAHVFYEGKFSADHKTGSVIVFSLLGGTIFPAQAEAPEEVASFSLAPHPEDPDIYIRKSFIEGLASVPNYYWLTRVVDAQGNPTPHYQDFLRCVQERSAGSILKVERN